MAGIADLSSIFHHIRVKLYPNYLPKAGKGTYIARTDSDKTVNVRDICSIMVTRAGFDGSFETLCDYVNQFMDEVAYQVCDGFTTNLGYFTIHPNIGGVFKTASEVHDHKKHPISFRFSALAKLRALVKNIDVEVVGIAEVSAYIDEFTDLEENTTNGPFVPGHGFAIHGHNIKIEGSHPDCGVYFQPVQAPQQMIKVDRILENNPTKIVGIAPNSPYPLNKVVVITQFSGGTILKDFRVITSPFTLEKL